MAFAVNIINQAGNNYWDRAALSLLGRYGERFVALIMRTPTNSKNYPHCKHCWNGNYKQSDPTDYADKNGCPYCYGTGYREGILKYYTGMCIISDTNTETNFGKFGTSTPYQKQVQLPPGFIPDKSDYILIFKRGSKAEYEAYKPSNIKAWSIRTGSGSDQDNEGIPGTMSNVNWIPHDNSAIYNFKLPDNFDDYIWDGTPREIIELTSEPRYSGKYRPEIEKEQEQSFEIDEANEESRENNFVVEKEKRKEEVEDFIDAKDWTNAIDFDDTKENNKPLSVSST